MRIAVESRPPTAKPVDLLAVPLTQLDPDRGRLPAPVAAVDRALSGRLKAVLATGDFRGREGESTLVYDHESRATGRILLIGLGKDTEVRASQLREAGGTAVAAAARRRAAQVGILVPSSRRVPTPRAVQALTEGAVLAGYRFDRYRSPREDAPGEVSAVSLLLEKPGALRAARKAALWGSTIAESQNLARDLSNEPPSKLPPAALARAAGKVAREVGLRCRIFDVAQLRARKMGAILAVGGGSSHAPRLIVLEHRAPPRRRGGAGSRTVCLVGKGVTFDSGGLSLKPSASMVSMKHDMSGGAAVIGTLRAAALLRLPIHLVGVIGAVENMPSGTAYRPDDIVTTMSGQTVEITNTDAEGRLVLADALHFARTEYAPAAIVDVATLTGACAIALGPWASAVIANDERLSESIREAGESTGERFWPLPLWSVHRKHMRSELADVKQTGGREAGTVTAAAFLSYFVGDTPWAHLDIASTANTERASPLQPKGATGFGVRSLVEFLRGWSDRPPV